MTAPRGRLEPVGPTLVTDRLVLRPWRDEDLDPAAAMNGDPETMRYFPAPLDREQSDAFVRAMAQSFAWSGAGMWAVEAPGVSPCIGAVGLLHVGFDAHFTPAVEVGWRLARAYWGRGYATEAGAASLRYGFDELGFDEVVSFTAEVNLPSQAVMVRLGMHRDPGGDFDHPRIPAGHPLSHHVLFRLHRADWPGDLG
ncbi:MAG: GNAT family N-acetyltransferase [Acidimicrobiales bacterium]